MTKHGIGLICFHCSVTWVAGRSCFFLGPNPKFCTWWITADLACAIKETFPHGPTLSMVDKKVNLLIRDYWTKWFSTTTCCRLAAAASSFSSSSSLSSTTTSNIMEFRCRTTKYDPPLKPPPRATRTGASSGCTWNRKWGHHYVFPCTGVALFGRRGTGIWQIFYVVRECC